MSTNFIVEGEKAAKSGIIHLLVLGSLKLVAGLVTGLTVLIADSISTFADTLGIFASYMGLKLSRKSADAHFEYGYYKIETIAALAISIGIIYLGYYILTQGIRNLQNPTGGQYLIFAVVATVVAIYTSYKLYKKLNEAGEKANSMSLIASAKDKKMDMIAGIAVLISIVANYQGIPYVEGVVSISIAILILKEGILSAKESLFFLLDYWDDPKLARSIKRVFKQDDDLIIAVKKIKLRRAGTFIFGEAFVEINPFAGFEDLRTELEILEKNIKELNPYIKDFAVFSHVPDFKMVKVAVPVKRGQDLNATVANNLRETTGYIFAEIGKKKIGKIYYKKLAGEDRQPATLAKFFTAEKVNILIDTKLNSLVYYNLRRTHHILIYPNFPDIKMVKQTLELLIIDT